MDFKLKGKSWAGNIYHQFESICQDVDDFMNKDTVKFVENQVQSVKRFYSNVVQDILPVSENTVSTKTLKHVNSVTDGIREATHVMEKQLSGNGGSVDTMRNSYTLFSDELSHALKLTALFNADPSQVSKDSILNDANHSFEEKNAWESMAPSAESSWENDIFCELFDENHENSTANKDSSPAISDGTERPATSSTIECTFGSKLLMGNLNPEVEKGVSVAGSPLHSSSDPVDGALLNSDESRGVSAQSVTPAKCDGTLYDYFSAKDETTSDSPLHSSGDPADMALMDSNETRSVSAQSVTPIKCDGALHNGFSARVETTSDSLLNSSSDITVVALVDSDETRSVSAQSITSAKCDGTLNDSFSAKDKTTSDSPLHSSSDLADVALVDSNENRSVSAQSMTSAKCDGTLHDSFSAKHETTPDMSTSLQSPELCFPYLTDEEGKIVTPSICSMSLESSNVSESISVDFIKKAESSLFSHVECGRYESKTEDVCFTDLISETNVGLSESRHDQEQLHEIVESKYSISSSRIGSARTFDFGDLNMETIDLSSDEKHDQDLVILNSSFTHLASHRRKNFKYYKKLIHDAFTSRRRVSKEYEHLSILYGDIDKEFGQHIQPSSVPSSPNHFFHALPEETRETDWELL